MDININMNANGGNNIWENHMSEAHKQCIMHKECKDCPLVGYQPLHTKSGNIYCETGRNKESEQS